ncbi:MAG: hypothetical protein ACKO2F_09640 [Cyanobacteriota bacterium]
MAESSVPSPAAGTGWEYRVIHIDVAGKAPPEPNPSEASQRLGGTLSPEFIAREFPDLYRRQQAKPLHPAAQLQHFLNALGEEGWELTQTAQIGQLLMFFFKRRRREDAPGSAD